MTDLDIATVSQLAGRVLDSVERAVVGKRDALSLILSTVLSRGHVLLEDFPGTRQDAWPPARSPRRWASSSAAPSSRRICCPAT